MGTVGVCGPVPKRKPSKPLLPGIYGPALPGAPGEPWEPRTAGSERALEPWGADNLPAGYVYLEPVRLLESRDLVRLLGDDMRLPVGMYDGYYPHGPLWIAALLTWVRCCYDRELYDYRMEALREIALNHQKTGLHEQIEVVWRLGGRVALFDFLRTIY